jgi:uncharacterized protein (DUF1330 family)
LLQPWSIDAVKPGLLMQLFPNELEARMRTLFVGGVSTLVGLAFSCVMVQEINAQTKPPVYFIVENEISDLQGYLKEYAPRARDMIRSNGGRYIAAGDTTTFVGEPPKSRVAIFAFDNIEQIQTWLNSAEYKELKKVGDKYAKFRNYAVPGVQQ